jgi:hypothetical protein
MGARTRSALAALATTAAVLAAACSPPAPADEPTTPVGDDAIGLDQLQYLGSHNSYKVRPSTGLLLALGIGSGLVPGVAQGLDPAQLDYGHRPLTEQLRSGLRTFELDIWADPTGGRFARPLAAQFLGQPYPAGVDAPGMKVLHIQEIDYRSTCPTLVACLGELRAWSDAHPGHLPITINLELKADPLPPPFDVTPIQPFDAAQLAAVDAEIRSVVGDRLITPDDVRDGAPDLRTAVTTVGWPSVRESRGRFLFFMDNADRRAAYLGLHPGLRGAVMFTSSGFGQPDAAVLKVNDPDDGRRIRELVEEGYLVRTRADADVVRPSTSQRDAALSSGGQLVHTDFPAGEAQAFTGYVVQFPTRAQARCNPVNTTPATCGPAVAVEPVRP